MGTIWAYTSPDYAEENCPPPPTPSFGKSFPGVPPTGVFAHLGPKAIWGVRPAKLGQARGCWPGERHLPRSLFRPELMAYIDPQSGQKFSYISYIRVCVCVCECACVGECVCVCV